MEFLTGRQGKVLLAVVQLIGLLCSVLLVTITYTNPDQVEERLQKFAIAEVERAVDAAWEAASGLSFGADRAERYGTLSRQLGIEAEALDIQRKQLVPALLAKSVSENCVRNCEFWVVAALSANSVMVERAAKLRVGQSTLQEFVQERYETSAQGLLLDLRRFGLVNVIVLSLTAALLMFRGFLNWRFAIFSMALTAYTVCATYGYVYNQNWALTVLLQDWAAPAYQIGMILIAFVLFDWLFLRGTITYLVVNIIGSIVPG